MDHEGHEEKLKEHEEKNKSGLKIKPNLFYFFTFAFLRALRGQFLKGINVGGE